MRPTAKQVLDPRVAYVMTTMMEAVINSGTGYPVRARGFAAPAAGKTGTSHDAWFAGYTSNLLCIVWVGNDDYTDIKLAGGAAAAPIWAEFMKRAVKLPAVLGHQGLFRAVGRGHRTVGQSDQPAGDAVVSARLHRGFHRRYRAEADLRPGFGGPSRIFHQDIRPGIATGSGSASQHEWAGRARKSRGAERCQWTIGPKPGTAGQEEETWILQPVVRQRGERGRTAK